jgi:hypothetical protein
MSSHGQVMFETHRQKQVEESKDAVLLQPKLMLPGDEEGDEMDLQAYYDAFNNQQTPIEEANES